MSSITPALDGPPRRRRADDGGFRVLVRSQAGLAQMQAGLAQMNALRQSGPATVLVDEFKQSVLKLVTDTVLGLEP